MKVQKKRQRSGVLHLLKGAVLLLSFLSVGLSVGSALAAGGVDVSKIDPLSPVKFLSSKAFNEKTERITAIPFEEKALSFEVHLPKGWKAELDPPLKIPGGGLSEHVLGEVARYTSPSRFNLRSFFTLEALELTYEIGARDWLINHLLNNGATLNALTEKSASEVEAIYVIVDADTTYAVRIKAIINGSRIILARYFVPQEDYKAERDMQAQVLASFKLTDPEEGGAEKWLSYGFLDQSYFDYPVSWKLSARPIKSIEKMQALLFTGLDNEKPDGQVKIYLTSKLLGTSLAEAVQTYRKKIGVKGYHLGELIQTKSFNYDESMVFGASEIYEMVPHPITMMPYELVVSVMESDEYYYIVSMLTPARKMEFYIWARNMEAFRIIVETMRRFNDTSDREEGGYYQYMDE